MQLHYLTLIASLFAGMALADGMNTSTPQQRAEFQTQYMKDKLALPDAVIPKVQALNLKYAEKMDPILKSSDNLLVKRQKGMAVMSAKDAELKAILTPDQFSAYDQAKDDLKDAMSARFDN